MPELDPKHVATQRTIATDLYKPFRERAGLPFDPLARDVFVTVVAPWVSYAGGPNDPESGDESALKKLDTLLDEVAKVRLTLDEMKRNTGR